MKNATQGTQNHSPRRPPFRRWLATLVLALIPSATQGDVSDGQWLLDYGQAHGIAATNPQTADAEFILVWLDAATELSPKLWDAYRWRSDLLLRLNRESDAIENLKIYCAGEPQDAPALLALFNLQLVSLQKIEDRIDLCNTFLARSKIPIEAASEVQLHIATLNEGQGDHDASLNHARKAIKVAPHNLAAHIFLNELENRSVVPDTQVDLMLRAIAIDPGAPQLPWQLAVYLEKIGLREHAFMWLQIASENWSRASGDLPRPPELLTEIVRIHLTDGKHAEAVSAAKKALEVDPKHAPASFVIIRAARQLGRTDLADAEASKLTNRFREWETNPYRADALTCFTIARYFLNIQPDPQRAVRYAELATQKNPLNLQYRQTLGQAYVDANLLTQAVQIFSAIAQLDAKSAIALANAQQSLGDQIAAIETLTSAAQLPSEHHDEIKRALEALNAPVPPAADLSPTKKRLTEFDKFSLSFAADPTQYIEFKAHLSSNICKFGQPLTAMVTLKNTSKRDLLLGNNRMLNPQVTVSLIADSTLGPHLENFITLDIPGEAIFKPGESRSVVQSLSNANGHLFLTSQPQRRIDLEAQFILDPIISENNTVISRYPNIQPVGVTFMRTPVDATDEGLAKLRQQLITPDKSQRVVATEAFVTLILERYDSMRNKPHTYHALPVDIGKLTKDALTTLRDPNPFVRAHALATLSRLPITPDIIQAATPLISDQHWLPRLLAVEFFAKKQGPVFLPVLERLANDPHPIVAKLATLYYDQAHPTKQSRNR